MTAPSGNIPAVRASLRLGLACALTAACGPDPLAPGTATDSEGTTLGHGVTGAIEPTTSGSTTPEPTTSGTSAPQDTTASTSGGLLPLDAGDGRRECSFALQDCPDGQKCIAHAADGEPIWSEFICVPIVDDPDAPGEPCESLDYPFGADTCDRGSTCWHVGADLVGHCLPNCWHDHACPEGSYCRLLADSEFAPMLCLTACDPLAQDCPNGEVCTYDEYWGPPAHNCYPPTGVVAHAPFDECAGFAYGLCAAGLACIVHADPPQCPQSGCCLPYCDLDAPGCPAELQCVAFLPDGEQAPPGYEDVGVCMQ